jgi:hypothetical protein
LEVTKEAGSTTELDDAIFSKSTKLAAGKPFNFWALAVNFLKIIFLEMDSSKLTQMKDEAANVYRSNWKPRDASEVTLRNGSIAANTGYARNQGPLPQCCAGSFGNDIVPNKGFTPSVLNVNIAEQAAGCASCADVNWGKSGGVRLKTCEEVNTILTRPLNPVKGQGLCCTSTEYISPKRDKGCPTIPSYTGWLNHIPTNGEPGHIQVYPLPPSH